MERPYNGHATFNETYNGLEVIIPTKKNWFIIIFLGAWLGGWTMGELLVISSLTGFLGGQMGFGNLFLLFWLCGWTTGGFFAFKTFLWNLKGKEVINFGQGYLSIEKKGMLFSKPKTYDLKEMKKIRVQEDNNDNGFWGGQRNNFGTFNSNGTLRFDYGLQTVKFASGIDEAEANYILNKLKASRILTDINFN